MPAQSELDIDLEALLDDADEELHLACGVCQRQPGRLVFRLLCGQRATLDQLVSRAQRRKCPRCWATHVCPDCGARLAIGRARSRTE